MKLMIRHLIVLLITISLSCKGGKQESNLDFLNEKDTTVNKLEQQMDTISMSMLEGIWAENEEENALFEISGDSIYYFEHPEYPVSYSLKGDTMRIKYEGLTTTNIILKLDSDSLIFITETGQVNRLYKRK